MRVTVIDVPHQEAITNHQLTILGETLLSKTNNLKNSNKLTKV